MNHHILKFFIAISFMLVSYLGLGQSASDSLRDQYFATAKKEIILKNYSSANNYFKKIFSLKTILSDELAYYYGLTQIKLNNYKKGKEALVKYIDLTSGKGEFYNESQQLIEEANKFICNKCNNTGIAEKADTCIVCKGLGKVEEDCGLCKSKGIETCAACHAKGVFVIAGGLGNTYSTCKKCNGKGFITCHICNGTKQKSVFCADCKGNGVFLRKITCPH